MTMLRNLHCHSKGKEQKKNFQTILVITFWNFATCLDSPQVKAALVIYYKQRYISCLKSYRTFKDLGLRKEKNIRKTSKLSADRS